MNRLVDVAAAISVLAFGATTVIALSKLPSRESGRSRTPLIALAAAMALYTFVGFSNVVQYAGITDALDLFEDYAELLFAPLLILAAAATEAQIRLDERSHSANMLQQQNDLLMDIVDTSPVGIMIVAPGGHITFANDPARHMLGIAESPDTGMLTHPAWTLVDAEGGAAPLENLAGDQRISGARRIMTWPDGRRQQFMFSVTPMSDASSSLGGAVVAVEAVTGR